MLLYTAMTIAGSDSGGGAGIQADLKTFQEYGVFGTSVITVITAQNTQGVQQIFPQSEQAVAEQIHAVLSDIGADAVKTGMLYSDKIIELIADLIRQYQVNNLVIDPVMYAKGGAPLLRQDAMAALKERLLPLAALITPNLPEACEILGIEKIRNKQQMKDAAKRMLELGSKCVLLKGGHLDDEVCVDLLYDGSDWVELNAKRVNTPHTHGTGCTLSAAIAAGLARGMTMKDSVALAKQYITTSIKHSPIIGQGIGPVGHHAFREHFPWASNSES